MPDISATAERGSLRELLRSARSTGPAGAAVLGRAASGALLQVALDDLEPNPWQYRSDDPEWIEELSGSIAAKGQLEAITFRTAPDGRKQIIGGHSRWRAFQLLRSRAASDEERGRYAAILANEKLDVTDEQMAEFAIIDNLLRKDPSLVDTARAIATFQEAHNLTLAEVSTRLNLEPDRTKRLLALNRAPDRVKRAVQEGVMVQLYDEEGQPLMTEAREGKPARPRREHRTLDLMQALELASLQAFLERHAPKRAEKKLEHLLERILEDGWTLRRVQTECKKEKDRIRESRAEPLGEAIEKGAVEPGNPANATKGLPLPLFRLNERELLVYLARPPTATPEQRSELRTQVNALLERL